MVGWGQVSLRNDLLTLGDTRKDLRKLLRSGLFHIFGDECV